MIAFFETYGDYAGEWLPRLAAAARVTATLSLLGFALALALGATLVAAQRTHRPALRRAAAAFVQFVRAVPLLALLLALYFGLPSFGVTLPGYWVGVLGLGIQGAAYVAEVLRGGREAALAAGLTPLAAFRHVVLPQAMRVMLPPLLNAYVSLLKDSSLCALIATDELMLTARAMASEYFLPLHVFVLVGLFYFAIAFPLSMCARLLARRLGRGRRTLGTNQG
jgi:His/Glu/Gln/Arg/opine family amino acid ABC transporter permease subunit